AGEGLHRERAGARLAPNADRSVPDPLAEGRLVEHELSASRVVEDDGLLIVELDAARKRAYRRAARFAHGPRAARRRRDVHDGLWGVRAAEEGKQEDGRGRAK